jgi:hypothetical protein
MDEWQVVEAGLGRWNGRYVGGIGQPALIQLGWQHSENWG